MMRKRTVFTLCDNHRHWVAESRQRRAEMFCEGGPGYGSPCAPVPCRVRPGSDIFAPTATDDLADAWVRGWAVNR